MGTRYRNKMRQACLFEHIIGVKTCKGIAKTAGNCCNK